MAPTAGAASRPWTPWLVGAWMRRSAASWTPREARPSSSSSTTLGTPPSARNARPRNNSPLRSLTVSLALPAGVRSCCLSSAARICLRRASMRARRPARSTATARRSCTSLPASRPRPQASAKLQTLVVAALASSLERVFPLASRLLATPATCVSRRSGSRWSSNHRSSRSSKSSMCSPLSCELSRSRLFCRSLRSLVTHALPNAVTPRSPCPKNAEESLQSPPPAPLSGRRRGSAPRARPCVTSTASSLPTAWRCAWTRWAIQ
mmetsp:Transcript_6893/g.14454  ORF Transcript_6893/g.14454 Transcript_6893/m.14454 type:complete len:264 (-) Transcript_6893:53-844(-)